VVMITGTVIGIAIVCCFIVASAYFISYQIGMYEALSTEAEEAAPSQATERTKAPRKRQGAKAQAPPENARPAQVAPKPAPSIRAVVSEPARAAYVAPKTPELQSWYGTLVRTSQQTRKDTASHQYQQFFAVIETSLGEQEVRGNDLERALRSANIQIGDRCGIKFHGMEDIVLSGDRGNVTNAKRKRYTAFKLTERSSNAKSASGNR